MGEARSGGTDVTADDRTGPVVSAACPYCAVELVKVPVRRSRCPHCREMIHVLWEF